MGWNHRVIQRRINDEEIYYQIHEVYYDDDGTIHGWTESPVSPCGESIDEVRQDLYRFLEALDKPILREDCGKETLVKI